MVAKSAFDEWQEAEDRRRERVAEDAARAARRGTRGGPHSIGPEVHRLIRENLRGACTDPGWQQAQTQAEHAVMESTDGFGALARMLARQPVRLTRIESRLGLLDEEAQRGE